MLVVIVWVVRMVVRLGLAWRWASGCSCTMVGGEGITLRRRVFVIVFLVARQAFTAMMFWRCCVHGSGRWRVVALMMCRLCLCGHVGRRVHRRTMVGTRSSGFTTRCSRGSACWVGQGECWPCGQGRIGPCIWRCAWVSRGSRGRTFIGRDVTG